MQKRFYSFLSVGLVLGLASNCLLSDLAWSPGNGNLRSQVSDEYDKAIDQALHAKELERAMRNVCRGC